MDLTHVLLQRCDDFAVADHGLVNLPCFAVQVRDQRCALVLLSSDDARAIVVYDDQAHMLDARAGDAGLDLCA